VRKILTVLCAVFFLGALVSCTNSLSLNDIMKAPQLPLEYVHLQEKIDELIDNKTSYSPPQNGENRYSVQLIDMNSDGVEEAVTFLKTSQTLKICLFNKQGEEYELRHTVDGDGDAFDEVCYVDLDADGNRELIVGRQFVNGSVCEISVYDVKSGEPVEVLSDVYSSFVVFDIDDDGMKELILIKSDKSVYAYKYRNGQFVKDSECQLSAAVSKVYSVKMGYITNMVPVLMIDGVSKDGGYTTDVIACRYGKMANIFSISKSGNIYADDINGDGILEIPDTLNMWSNDGVGDGCYIVSWYSLTLSGRISCIETTYHNCYENWYLKLFGSLKEDVEIKYDEEINKTEFILDDEVVLTVDAVKIGSVYEDTGIKLGSWIDYAFYAKLSDNISENNVKSNFNIIMDEWQSEVE